MKTKTILNVLFSGLLINAGSLHATDCPCDGGTAEYSVDCSGDGTPDACSSDDCPPCSEKNPNPSTPGYECCGEEEYDPLPTAFTPQEWNIQMLMDLYNDAKSVLTAIGPCQDSGGGAPNLGVEISFFKDCCNEEVTDLNEYRGYVYWDLGSTTCDWPILGIPYVASANITANAGFAVSIGASGIQTCEDMNLCFNGDATMAFGGGVSATAAAGVIRVSATLQVSTGAQVEYCIESGLDATVCIGTVAVIGTAELAFVTKAISYTLHQGNC